MTHSKTFRFFISSTFNDFRLERQRLHERVFPAIEDYLKANHPDYTFLPIDLRWGVTEEAQHDQQTLQVCLNEVRSCKEYLHPNFFIMVGNRYGWTPLPYAIEQDKFEKIKHYTQKKKQQDYLNIRYGKRASYLKKWYQLDENHIPVSYILKDRIGTYREFSNWEAIENTLRDILQEAIVSIDIESIDYRHYFTSATEREVHEGSLHYKKQLTNNTTNKYCFGFIRDIENSDDSNYIDQDQRNVIAFKQNLVDSQILLDRESVSLGSETTFVNKEQYLDIFEQTTTVRLQEAIQTQITEHKNKFSDQQAIQSEEQHHFQTQKIEVFEGRKDELKKVHNYLENKTTTQPFVIHGASGIGKSSFLAKVIDSMEDKDNLFYRFIGVSAKTSDTRLLLESLLDQLINKKIITKPFSYEQDNHLFYQQVCGLFESIKEPTTIILDALDQLQTKESPIWLPIKLPKNLKIIVSVLDEKDTYYWEYLNDIVDKENQLHLNELSDREIENALDRLLVDAKRNLTNKQKNYAIEQIKKSNNSPLYLKIVFETIKRWRSFDTPDLEVGIEEAIKAYIENLKKKFYNYGDAVDKIFGLLRASKDGLSEKEILELLSRDEKLLKPLEKFHPLKLTIKGQTVRKFPTAIWARLYEHIKPFLMTRLIDAQELFSFFHRQFDEVVGSYLYESSKEKLHKELADYFMSMEEPIKLWNKRYPIRMLSELPYHLVEIKDTEALKKIAFNLEFNGVIYDNHKQREFQETLSKGELSKERLDIWKSFFNEHEVLITKINNSDWKPHQTLFQLAYEDGLNSPLHEKAKKVIEMKRVDWSWFKKADIKIELERKVVASYHLKQDDLEIHINFNCVVLENHFIFYYQQEIYIFDKNLKYKEKQKSINTLKYFKTFKCNDIHFVFFEKGILLIKQNNYTLMENYIENVFKDVIFKDVPPNIKVKSVFYKNEIFFLIGSVNSRFEHFCENDSDYLVVDQNGEKNPETFDAMVIDKDSGVRMVFILNLDNTTTQLANISHMKKYLKVYETNGSIIYYQQDDEYYHYDKKTKVFEKDNNPPKDNVRVCSKNDYIENPFYSESDEYYAELEEDHYDLMTEEERREEELRNDYYEDIKPNEKIIPENVKSTSGDNYQVITSPHFSEYTYQIDNQHYLSIDKEYLLLIKKPDFQKNSTHDSKKYFQQLNQEEKVYWIDDESFIIHNLKKSKLEIIFQNKIRGVAT